jgi:hypothetical protein
MTNQSPNTKSHKSSSNMSSSSNHIPPAAILDRTRKDIQGTISIQQKV